MTFTLKVNWFHALIRSISRRIGIGRKRIHTLGHRRV